MKSTTHTVAIIATSIILFSQVSFAEEWYEGGTLHTASIPQWKSSTHKNRLATASDWAAVMFKDQNLSMKELKVKALEVVRCIDTATAGSTESLLSSAAEAAAICHILIEAQ